MRGWCKFCCSCTTQCNSTCIRTGVRSVTSTAGTRTCSPCPSPHSRRSSFHWQDKSRLSASSGSITALQDLYTVDGIKTSPWTPKFINNQGEKKLGVWWRQDTCIFLLACQGQWECLKGGGWDASGRNTLWSRAEARGPGFLFSFLMKLSMTPDSTEVHPRAYDNNKLN